MVDTAARGLTGAPFVMDVERGKIREFARATFSANPAYLDGLTPYAPPTFLSTAAFWQRGEADPWAAVAMDTRRGLHAEQEFVFHGPPPRAGDRLTGQSSIVDIYQREGRRGGTLTFAVMRTEFRDGAGRLVAEAVLTGVETSDPPVAAPTQPTPPDHTGGTDVWLVGPLTRTDLVRYQGASGDFYAIHHDEPFARAAGFATPLSLGMLHAGLLGTWCTDRYGAGAIRRLTVRFAAPVFPGDTLACSGGAVGGSTVEGSESTVDLELSCRNQAGAVAVRGSATFAVPAVQEGNQT